MKISQILMQPIGQRFNAGTLTIKTCKKTWQVDEIWYHQVIFMDNTGEIPADVQLGKYLPFKRGQEVSLIICAVRESEYLGKPRKTLFVEQYSIPTTSMDEFESRQDEIDKEVRLTVRSKIKCWLVSARVPVANLDELLRFATSPILDQIVDAIYGERK